MGKAYKKESKTDKNFLSSTLKRVQPKNKKSEKNYLLASLLLDLFASFWLLGALSTFGKADATIFAFFALFFCLISAFFCGTTFLKLKSKKEKNRLKPLLMLSLTGVIVLASLICAIASPIAKNIHCSSFNSVDEMTSAEEATCQKQVEKIKAKAEAEENAKKEAINKAKDECSAKNYSWNSSENRCNTDEEQEKEDNEKKAKSECSEKGFDWNYSENRCNDDSEQEAANQKKAEEEARRAEANKTTTYNGIDHDANDNEGKYTSLMNKCLDRVDYHYPGAYPLDSNDGDPIQYSVTLKGDGTLVEGAMVGKIKTQYGNKILEYRCIYKDGSAKIRGLD